MQLKREYLCLRLMHFRRSFHGNVRIISFAVLSTLFGKFLRSVFRRDANLSSKFLSGQLDNFLALSGQCPDNWTIFKLLVNRLSTK